MKVVLRLLTALTLVSIPSLALAAEEEWVRIASNATTLFFVKPSAADYGNRDGVPTASGVVRKIDQATQKTETYAVAVMAADCVRNRGAIQLVNQTTNARMQTEFLIGDKRAISVIAKLLIRTGQYSAAFNAVALHSN